jgi:DNA uptake protein ComE-like DNA-binding protein
MKRIPAVSTLLSLSAMVALSSCSSDANKAADTTVAVPDTAVTTAATSTPAVVDTKVDASGARIVPMNINTATDAQILAIPGVGPRMLREFKEYRPYTSIEQFRREIGKYVDKAEVARLEQYIVIK